MRDAQPIQTPWSILQALSFGGREPVFIYYWSDDHPPGNTTIATRSLPNTQRTPRQVTGGYLLPASMGTDAIGAGVRDVSRRQRLKAYYREHARTAPALQNVCC